MNLKQLSIVTLIKCQLNDRNIIYNLKLAIETDQGYMIPAIHVFIEPNLQSGFIAIENMGGKLAQLDNENIISSISGLLSVKRLRKYSLVSGELSKDGNYYFYYFEDVTTSQRLLINENNLKQQVSNNKHELRLSKNLIWNTSSSTPHLSVIGRTRSGKSFFVGEYLLPLMKLQEWKVEFFSVKNDIYVDKYHGEFEPEKIIQRLEFWITVMNDRNAEIRKAGKTKYTQIKNMADVALVIDEIGNLNAAVSLDRKLKLRWESAITKLTATGASAGIHIIALSQYGTKDGFLPSTARANVSDAVIMLGLAADNATDRQYMLPGFELPHRNYETGQGIARIVSAGKKWEVPHFFETPLFK